MSDSHTFPAGAGTLIDRSLFVDDAGSALVGSRCRDCGAVAFPQQASCARCTSTDVGAHALATTGTVWASTVQRFTPKPPYAGAAAGPAVYGVGYVDLGDVLVESRLLGLPDELGIGAAVELVLETLPGTEDRPVRCFAFAPRRPPAAQEEPRDADS